MLIKKIDLSLHTECIFNALTDAILKGAAYYRCNAINVLNIYSVYSDCVY